MNDFSKNRVSIEIEVPVHIPSDDGKSVRETVMVKVPALKDLRDGEIYLTGEAMEMLDKTKARLMGVLLPSELKELRQRLGFTQAQMCELLDIGAKTYTRWERGRERVSKSFNRLLVALWEGRLNVCDLQNSRQPEFSWFDKLFTANSEFDTNIWGYGQVCESPEPL